MVPVKGKVRREQRMHVRSAPPVPDRIPDPRGSRTMYGFPCHRSEHKGWKPQPVEAHGVSDVTLKGCTEFPAALCAPRGLQGYPPCVTGTCQFASLFGFWSSFHSSPYYITSSCPSTVLNCCVHPASSFTLSVISLAAPGDGY